MVPFFETSGSGWPAAAVPAAHVAYYAACAAAGLLLAWWVMRRAPARLIVGPARFVDKKIGFALDLAPGWIGKRLPGEVVAVFQNPASQVRLTVHAPVFRNLPQLAGLSFHACALKYVDELKRDIGNARSHYRDERLAPYLTSIPCNDGSSIPALTVDYTFQGVPHRKIACFAKRGADWAFEILLTLSPADREGDYDAVVRSFTLHL